MADSYKKFFIARSLLNMLIMKEQIISSSRKPLPTTDLLMKKCAKPEKNCSAIFLGQEKSRKIFLWTPRFSAGMKRAFCQISNSPF